MKKIFVVLVVLALLVFGGLKVFTMYTIYKINEGFPSSFDFKDEAFMYVMPEDLSLETDYEPGETWSLEPISGVEMFSTQSFDEDILYDEDLGMALLKKDEELFIWFKHFEVFSGSLNTEDIFPAPFNFDDVNMSSWYDVLDMSYSLTPDDLGFFSVGKSAIRKYLALAYGYAMTPRLGSDDFPPVLYKFDNGIIRGFLWNVDTFFLAMFFDGQDNYYEINFNGSFSLDEVKWMLENSSWLAGNKVSNKNKYE